MEELKLVGRIVLAIYIWIAAYQNSTGFTATVDMLDGLKFPRPRFVMPVVIVFEIVAPICLFIPAVAMYAALLLAAFCVAAPTIAHAFWKMPDTFERFLHKNLFFANCAVAAGMLLLAAISATG